MANQDLEARKVLLNQLNLMQAKLEETLTKITDKNAKSVKSLTEEIEKADKRLSALDNSATSLYKQLVGITSEFKKQKTPLDNVRSTLRKVTDIAQQLRDDEQGIVDLNKNQVKRIQEKLKVNQKFLKDQLDGIKDQLKSKRLSKDRRDELEASKLLIEDENNAINKTLETANDRLKQEKRISKQMGVTGAIIGGTGALMERLGMRSGIFQDAIEDAQESMRMTAKQADAMGKKVSKAQLAFIGISKVAKGFGQALFDPLTITSAIVNKFFELNAASTKLMRLTGQNAGIQAAHNQSLASGAQVMEVMAEMTERTGIAAAAMFSSADLGRLAETKNLLGLSSEQASNLGMYSKVSGTSIQGYKEELVASVNEFNAMNDSAVAHGVVMRDVLDASADISMSLGGNPKKIAAAASAARKLGLDLAKVNQIADGLMNFESSIESELEAQLLTGKQINLSKARELALNNDLEGLAKELAKNGASASEFAKMNRIQQEGMAKALGMSREEMGKMLINQEGQKNLSKEQRAAMRGVTLEQLEQMEASESLKLAFSKMAEPLASILNILAPIVTMIAKAVAFVAPIATPIYLAVKAFQLLNSGILGSIKNMGKLLTSTSLFGKMYKGGQFMPGGGRAKAGGQRAGGLLSSLFGKKGAPTVPQGAGNTIGDLGKKTKDIKADSGAGIKGFLKGLGDGLASIGNQFGNVVKGALALGIAGLALGGSFALALRMVKDIDPAQMLAFAGSLTMLGLTLALLGNVGGNIIAGALAMGILGVALIPAAYGFSLLKDIQPGQMFAFAGALTLLGLAAAGLGFLFPFIAAGAGALALLGVALIPAAYGFSLIQGLDMDTILSFAAGVGVLGTTAAGLGLVAQLIIFGSVAIAALGAALVPLSYGFAALGNTPIESIIEKLQGLAAIAPQLMLVGLGLMSIAAGLGMIAVAGIAAIPALTALSAFALIAAPLAALAGLFGEGGGEEDGGMAEISAKLDTLISVVSAGGNVYLDGNKVGEAQVLGTFKLS